MKHPRLLILSTLLLAFNLVLSAAPQPGYGWTAKTVADGVVYYTFSGTEEISGAPQQVFVIDLDLNNPHYALRFSWSDPAEVTSEIFRRNDALVAMNAAYEHTSIVAKTNGTLWTCMPYDVVMKTPVPNWKSEGAVYTDGMQNVRISFDGRGLDIEGQREIFAEAPDPNILTSSPMLIDDYDPVGARFVDSTLTMAELEKFHYEDPIRHQGVRHPRTAIAKTADNHLIMLVVDGRHPGVSEGMNARELTRFLERHFHPQYALNMDGGGSTTLCVRGEGDPQTHVVNYPPNNRRFDHTGERRVGTHFYVVEVPAGEAKPLYPRENVREEVRADRMLAAGLDRTLDWGPKAATPAPKGYEPVYISHYGRHGSRFAYADRTYSLPLQMLREGADHGNLTEYGKELLDQLEDFYETARYQVGDLTSIGWEQHQQIARTMVSSFPTVFVKGSTVDACSSASVRSILSMTSCCTSLARETPQTAIYAHQGVLDIQATRPNQGRNPFRYTGPDTYIPFPENSEQYFLRKFPNYLDVIGRMFKDPVAAMGDRNAYDTFFYLYMFVAGMNSLPEEVRVDVGPMMTDEEFATLWEIDNFERFREYIDYRTSCSSIVDDMVAKADERLAAGSRGADLRYGHDHVVMALEMIMDIEGFGYVPTRADDLVYTFQTFRSPMAANIQLIFYQPKRGRQGETLVKLLLNGEEARLGALVPVAGPYYSWSDVRDYLAQRTDLFVAR